jgi:four helix bundle suffix protein
MTNQEPLIPKHGGYRKLKSFQMAEIVYDATMAFCNRFISKRSRTHDQMVQAARSGKQNIAEGSQASGTSRKFELKLVSVARASLEDMEQKPDKIAANAMICVIHQTNYLLDQQLRQLEKQFLEQGGFTERLFRVRSENRRKRF